MSPQPTAAPAKPADAEKPAEQAATTSEPVFQPNLDTAGGRQIDRAMKLERERSVLMDKIGKNREYLRLMAQNDELTDDEADWVDVFYPEKEKGEQRSKEEIEATRKLREQARNRK